MMGIGAAHSKDPNGIAWKQNRDFERLLERLNGSDTPSESEGKAAPVMDGFHAASSTGEEVSKEERKRKRKEEKEDKKSKKKRKQEEAEESPSPPPIADVIAAAEASVSSEPTPRAIPRHRA
jgi:Pin2-interacting protein X1